ncbi:MAG: DUF7691 family protein [Actinomycetota bacterium]
MSYSLVPYLVDLEQLRQAVGGKNEALLAAVIAGNPDALQDAEPDDEELSLAQALRHLVMGEPLDAGSAHQYGYALMELCRHLGEELPERDLWESIHSNVLESTGADELLSRTGAPVPLPKIDDFPYIGHLEAAQISALVDRLGGGRLISASPTGRKPRRSFRSWLIGKLLSRITRRGPMTAEEVRECLDEYEGWLRAAAAKKKSLVFFYH